MGFDVRRERQTLRVPIPCALQRHCSVAKSCGIIVRENHTFHFEIFEIRFETESCVSFLPPLKKEAKRELT